MTLEHLFGTPFLHYPCLPIGVYESGKFLRTVGSFADVERGIIETVIEKHEQEFYYYIERTSNVFLENRTMSRRFSLVSNADDTLSISRFLVNDFGLVPEKQYITDATPIEHQDRIRKLFTEYVYGIAAEIDFQPTGT